MFAAVALTFTAGAVAVSTSTTGTAPVNGKILFSTSRDRSFELYTINGDGQNEAALPAERATGSESAFSPDGSKIAYAFNRDDGNTDIYVMQQDGSHKYRLTTAPGQDRHPAFSPDGKRIAFASESKLGAARH